MKNYLAQLLHDLDNATQTLAWPYLKQTAVSLHDVLSREEEDISAPLRNLPEWTGIKPDMLPPASMLQEEEISTVLKALTQLLAACNCHVVFQTVVPERFQYEAIRQNFNQDVRVYQWNDGFFEFCKPGTAPKTCALSDHCQCAFYHELFEGFEEENLTPEEERERELACEILHIQKKYGDDWMKYYPYHLDKAYDDEYGNPYNYGFEEDDDKDEDNWWKH